VTQFPKTLEEVIAQAQEATVEAIEAGNTRVQVELEIPEVSLKSQAIAWEFTAIFQEFLEGLKVIFPDTGAAALARRDWGEVPFTVTDLGSRNTSIETKVDSEDVAFLVVCPSAVEVGKVETLCNLAGDRPVVLLIPQLEDVATVGIGYAARQIRERFLSTLETSYHIKPLEGAAILRRFPSQWQVWLEKDNDYELIAEEPQKPVGDHLQLILAQATGTDEPTTEATPAPKKTGLLANLQRFLRALSQ
jgi:hypothetical protein